MWLATELTAECMQGSEKRWCFSCSDSGDMYEAAIQCITVRTKLCEVVPPNPSLS